mmetsp:Transcript_91942/g.152303  ORF Transcript_91942/g.152303 Transcript_91942/m.152303 type:complete len:120 (-) Transcript_91942:288-647(-)
MLTKDRSATACKQRMTCCRWRLQVTNAPNPTPITAPAIWNKQLPIPALTSETPTPTSNIGLTFCKTMATLVTMPKQAICDDTGDLQQACNSDQRLKDELAMTLGIHSQQLVSRASPMQM